MASSTALDVRDAPASGSPWVLFWTVSVALTMASIDQTIVAVALPTIARELHAGINWSSWIIGAYSLGLMVAMPLAGRTSDLYGRKAVFLGSILLFSLSSLLCGSATGVSELIVLRAVQALGGGAFLPSAIGIIADAFGDARDRAVGMVSSVLPIGGLIAPALGGVFLHFWTWRAIFWINVPFGAVLFVVAVRLIPRTPPRPGAKTDLLGVALLSTGVLGVMAAITTLGNGGVELWSWPVPAAAALALASFALLRRHLARAPSPLIPRGLVRGRGFLAVNLLNLLVGCFLLGLGALLPLYAQERYHLNPLDAATLLTGRSIGLIGLAVVTARVMDRVGYRLPIGLGLVGTIVGTVMLAAPPVALSPYWWLSAGGTVTGCAFGFAAPAIANASLSLAPDHVGAITGLRGLFRQAGTILGVTVATTLAARSSHPGSVLALTIWVAAAVFVGPLVALRRIPERLGSW